MKKDTIWKKISSEIVAKNAWFQVRKDLVIRPDGKEAEYNYVQKPDFAVAIPFDGAHFYLVEQYRYTFNARSLEFPMGSTNRGESPENCAKRELREETGLVASKMLNLGYVWTANGFASQGFTVFVVTDLIQKKPEREDSESDIVVKKFSLEALQEMVGNNTIKDGPTLAAFALFVSQSHMVSDHKFAMRSSDIRQ